ncbi:hypothetical protein ACJX0J_033813, partial [Zea mays]
YVYCLVILQPILIINKKEQQSGAGQSISQLPEHIRDYMYLKRKTLVNCLIVININLAVRAIHLIIEKVPLGPPKQQWSKEDQSIVIIFDVLYNLKLLECIDWLLIWHKQEQITSI